MVLEIPVTEARAQFAELVNRVGYGGEEIVLTRHGKPLVALVPAKNLRNQQNPASEQVLDLTSTRGSTRDEFGLTARDTYSPPRVGD